MDGARSAGEAGWGPRGRGSIRVSGVSRRFKDVQVLEDVDIEIGPGQVGALIGPNGSGKTTLLRVIAGILTPNEGEVSVAGEPPGKGRAGYVVAGDRGLYWRLTTLQNMEFFAGIAGFPPEESRECARRVLDALNAAALGPKRVEVCSTGQRRRVAIARGFVTRAPVILVDEPFADLDEEGCAAVSGLISRWAEQGGTVLYAAPMQGAGPPFDLQFELSAESSVAARAGRG
jgi:ABC-2 type transport system ATP-binding protein